MYKVKTFKEITKLERNGMFVYESVPGTAVFDLAQDGSQMSFRVEGPEDAQITVELEAEAQYEVYLDGASTGKNGDQPWRKAFFQRRTWKWLSC